MGLAAARTQQRAWIKLLAISLVAIHFLLGSALTTICDVRVFINRLLHNKSVLIYLMIRNWIKNLA